MAIRASWGHLVAGLSGYPHKCPGTTGCHSESLHATAGTPLLTTCFFYFSQTSLDVFWKSLDVYGG